MSQNSEEYYFINEPKSWDEAQMFCRKYYKDLATVNNIKDLERLRAAAYGQTDVWIGLYQTSDDLTDRKWHWSQPEVKYSYSEWSSGEPSDSGSNPIQLEEGFPYLFGSGTWLEAQQYCRKYHTDLISGQDQLIQLIESIPNRVDCWIGLSRDNWGWSDGSDSSFRSWNTSVNPTDQKCAALVEEGRWESQDCALKKRFICNAEAFAEEDFVGMVLSPTETTEVHLLHLHLTVMCLQNLLAPPAPDCHLSLTPVSTSNCTCSSS
ncbi:hypothetical protein WMY93_015101 [Mugilogobius chulae]|uniref:C-type lectin domain-containing protein n=1 Tax=Mugilogobius chulae TaxID=88201 RepID=A0AAW0P3H1_9GOBI